MDAPELRLGMTKDMKGGVLEHKREDSDTNLAGTFPADLVFFGYTRPQVFEESPRRQKGTAATNELRMTMVFFNMPRKPTIWRWQKIVGVRT